MSEQEKAKIDRFIAWLLEHPDKIPAAEQALRPRITENPLRRATPARHKGFLFYRVRTISFFGFYGNDIFCCCHIVHGHCLLTRLA